MMLVDFMTAPINDSPLQTAQPVPPISSRSSLLGNLRSSFMDGSAVLKSGQPTSPPPVSAAQSPQPVPATAPVIDQMEALKTLEQSIAAVATDSTVPSVSVDNDTLTVTPSMGPPSGDSFSALSTTNIVEPPAVVVDEVNNEIAESTPPQPLVDPMESVAAAVPQAIATSTNTLQYQYPSTRAKEVIEVSGPTISPTEVGASAGPVEVEPPRELELPVEVESFIQKVEQNDQLPQEIVIAGDGASINVQNYVKQPVIVLPITPEEEKEGAKKDPTHSFRWLVEWSRKVMKLFNGMVIYRDDSQD